MLLYNIMFVSGGYETERATQKQTTLCGSIQIWKEKGHSEVMTQKRRGRERPQIERVFDGMNEANSVNIPEMQESK